MIGPGMLDCRSSLLQVSSLRSPVLLGSQQKKVAVLGRSHSVVVCEASVGSGQSRFASGFRKLNHPKKKNVRWRGGLVRCEADGAGQGVETTASEESNGMAKSSSSSIVSEVENRAAGQDLAEMDDPCPNERESPVTILKELLRLAHEDLEMARKNSERLAERARKVAEKAMTLQEEAMTVDKVFDDTKTEMDDILQRESEGEVALASASSAREAAHKHLKKVEMASRTAQSGVRGEDNGLSAPDDVQVRLQGADATEEAKLEGSLDIATEDKVGISVGGVNCEAGVETVEVQEKGITDQEDAATLEWEKE